MEIQDMLVNLLRDGPVMLSQICPRFKKKYPGSDLSYKVRWTEWFRFDGHCEHSQKIVQDWGFSKLVNMIDCMPSKIARYRLDGTSEYMIGSIVQGNQNSQSKFGISNH